VDGRAITAGDRFGVERSGSSVPSPGAIVAPWLDRPVNTIRVVLGPQHDYFADDPDRRVSGRAVGPSPPMSIAWHIFLKDRLRQARLQYRV
jgi:hypothetical protein